MAGAEKAVATMLYASPARCRRAGEADEDELDGQPDRRSRPRQAVSRRRPRGARPARRHARRSPPASSSPIVGPSGSGKSTFMHILGCLDRPTSGRYLLNGRDVSTLPDDELARVRNETIGFVFQGFNLLARTSALENVELPLLYTRTGRREGGRAPRARDGGARGGRAHRPRRAPSQSAVGRPAAARRHRARAGERAVAPARRRADRNLDTATSVEVMEIFQRLKHERGITIVVITHERTSPPTARAPSGSRTA